MLSVYVRGFKVKGRVGPELQRAGLEAGSDRRAPEAKHCMAS